LKLTVAACAVAVASSFLSVAAAVRADVSQVPGHVVLARTEEDALAIWDSTPEVAAIVNDKVSDADAKARLELDALRVLAQVQPKISSNAKTITIRVIYSKSGEVSKVYGTPTFAGVERYANLKVKAADAASDRDKWKELGDKAAPPAWVDFEVVGELPPR
jgi:hypothetical protein